MQTNNQLTDLQADLKGHFDKLPKDVQQAILSVDFGKELKEITSRYKLHIDQGAQLETETTLVMLGLVPPKEYARNLVAEAHIDPVAADAIANEINDKIFRPIISSLHEALLTQMGGEEEETLSAAEHTHDLSPVEIGVSTVAISRPERNRVPEASQDTASDQKATAMFAQKLEGIAGQKPSETVVTDESDAKKKIEKEMPESPYKGSDPYHEPIE